jgi:hypothetical protein
MATTVPSASVPLYTFPYPPWPISVESSKSFVQCDSSSKVKSFTPAIFIEILFAASDNRTLSFEQHTGNAAQPNSKSYINDILICTLIALLIVRGQLKHYFILTKKQTF